MNDIFKIVLTAGTTLIGGVVLLILSKIFVEPIQELKGIIGEIAAHVFTSHNLLTNVPKPNEDEIKLATEKLQELSAKFRASINTVPWISVFACIKILPPKRNLLKAAGYLSKISYAPYETDKGKISKQIDCLYKLLNLDMYGK